MATPNKWRIRLLAVILLLFCVAGGFAAGIIADRIYLVTHGRMLPPGGAQFVTHHIAHRLDRSLDLSDTQEQQVRQILERRRERILGDWRNLHARFHQEIEEADREIAAVLTPQQRERFERMQRHWRGRRCP